MAKLKWHKRAAAVLLACLMTGTALPLTTARAEEPAETAAADVPDSGADADSGDLSYEQQQTYSDYYDTYSGQTRPNAEILLNGADFQSADCAQYEVGSYTGEEDGSTRDNALIWNSADGSFTYTIQVPETGVYSIEATYCPLVSNTSEISFSLAIDGEIPYDTASRLTLNKVYRNKEDMKEDSKGNQVRPTQVQTEMWRTCWIGDSDGLFNEPLLLYVS